MDHHTYRDGVLWTEEKPAADLAHQFGTPLYIYSQKTFLHHLDGIRTAFAELSPQICYSVKCCPNTHILRLLHEHGSGFDVVSGGELFRALQAGADPAGIVFAGVGKTDMELGEAMDAGVGLINIESVSEFEQLGRIAQARRQAVDAALRINPDVDPQTHKYTSTGHGAAKFGVDLTRAEDIFRTLDPNGPVRLIGLHLHIGSPVHAIDAYTRSVERALELTDTLRAAGHTIDTLDIGGGYGAHYHDEEAPPPSAYAQTLVSMLRDRDLRVILEPGRSIAANAGILLTRVLHVKQAGTRRFVIVDAAMTDLIRPALYGAYHFIWPTDAGSFVPPSRAEEQPFLGLCPSEVVGPVCETGDFLAQDRQLPPVKRGDLLAVFSTGAYGMAMASQYNSRPRAAEVLVNADTARLIRRRETYADLVGPEEIVD